MERWEEQIDVDDSDLHSFFHLHSQPSFSPSPQTLPRSLHPCSQNRSSSQTLDTNPPIALSQTNRIEEDLKTASTSRPPIPGPAGAIQAAMRRQSAIGAAKCSPLAEEGSHGRYLCETEDLDFELNPWLCALSSLGEWRGISGKDSGSCLSNPISSICAKRCGTERIPQVVGIVTDSKQNGLGDLFITLKDPTGRIGASVHRKVLFEEIVGREISVGCVLILKQVVAFRPSRSHCYLNITLKNLVKLFEKDCGPPEKQIAHPFSVVHEAVKNVTQLRMELPAGDQPLCVKKTSYAEPRRSFIGERTENCRKTFLPESANTAVKSDTRMNEPKKLISGALVPEWTDEQLEKLFSEYDDDF